jgi:biopolymer transport protein ExbD
MHLPSPRATRRARIEIIPLIDIMFFLLATFVMVSLSLVQNQAVPVRLPVAVSGAPQERKQQVVLSITEMGSLYYNQEPIIIEALPARLAQLKKEQADPKVFIHGDGNTAFSLVVAVLDETRKAGISKVAIETQKARGSH